MRLRGNASIYSRFTTPYRRRLAASNMSRVDIFAVASIAVLWNDRVGSVCT
jgi:hypothetical protein